jgi:hypothetical protein
MPPLLVTGLHVPVPDPHSAGIKCEPQSFFTLAQRSFGLPAHGNIIMDEHDLLERSGIVLERVGNR